MMKTTIDGEYRVTETDGGAIIREIASTPDAIALPRRLTKLEFFDRFTQDEQISIYAMAKTSPDVELWLDRFKLVTPDPDGSSIDLTDPRTIAGVQGLEALGLIGSGRAAEILS